MFRIMVSVGLCISSAKQLRRTRRGSPVSRVELANFNDVLYQATLTLGGQEFLVVPDTGSHELVMFALVNASGSLTEGSVNALKVFGGGNNEWSVQSLEAYDDLTLGDVSLGQQLFWEVQASDKMPAVDSAGVDGIFGLGSPSGNVNIAQQDAAAAYKKLSILKEQGQDVTGLDTLCSEYQQVADFTKTSSNFIQSVAMQRFSICLGAEAGSPGYLVLNDDADPSTFPHTVPVSGGLYWSTPLSELIIESELGVKHGTNSFGCSSKLGPGLDCIAIFDSGTSFLAAPQDIFDKIVRIVQEFSSFLGGCSDLTQFPDITFGIGSQRLSLPPQSYIGQVTGTKIDGVPAKALLHMPHLEDLRAAAEQQFPPFDGTFCAPLIMSSQITATWILGMPFFRKYYTMFELSSDNMDAANLYFSEADESCNIASGASLRKSPSAPLKINIDDLTNMLPQRHSSK